MPPEPEPPAWMPLFWMDPVTGCHYWRDTNQPRYALTPEGHVTMYCTDEDGALVLPGNRKVPPALLRRKTVKTASYSAEGLAWVRFAEPVAGATVQIRTEARR